MQSAREYYFYILAFAQTCTVQFDANPSFISALLGAKSGYRQGE